MNNTTRRHFLRGLSAGAAALSTIAEGRGATLDGQAAQMPGRPSTGDTEGHPARPADIMVIAAHPGDAFFAMGAPVALQTHLGSRGVFLSLTLGERGSAGIPPARYGQMQRESAERAAGLLGARAVFLDYRDGELPASEEAKLAVCDAIREHKPEVVVTHWRGSWHKDHQACYAIVNDAVFYAGLPALARQEPAHNVRSVFFADNWEDAEGFEADTFLDISEVCDRWIEACAAFPMWKGENGFRYNDYYSSLAIQRGCLSGFERAVALMSPPEQLTRRAKGL